ncbi:hypothetical protein MP228_002386 [Amoeboaphelidium protococcarum]|nr:hypothetical protein MP228_002386 [Amoeboaphelidium protococcarum]
MKVKVSLCEDKQTNILQLPSGQLTNDLNVFEFQKAGAISGKSTSNDDVVVHAENEKIELTGSSKASSTIAPHTRYAVCVYDKKTKSLQILPPTRLIDMQLTVKNLKAIAIEQQVETRVSSTLKRDLGQAFGTRKSQSAINSYDRGVINVGQLQGVQSHLESAIDEKAGGLRTTQQIENDSNLHSRLLPQFDATTDKQDCVFKLEDMIPKDDFERIPLDVDVNDARLPTHIKSKLRVAKEMDDQRKIRLCVLVVYLIQFRSLTSFQLNDKSYWQQNLIFPIPQPVDALLFETFTEWHQISQTGKSKRMVSTQNKEKLTNYIAIICLMIDNFKVEVSSLAKDLQLTGTKCIDVFRSCGCAVEYAVIDGQRKKVLKLQAPIQFPKASRGRMR